jgi:hypothetical protein
MWPEVSFPCSQDPITHACSEPDKLVQSDDQLPFTEKLCIDRSISTLIISLLVGRNSGKNIAGKSMYVLLY